MAILKHKHPPQGTRRTFSAKSEASIEAAGNRLVTSTRLLIAEPWLKDLRDSLDRRDYKSANALLLNLKQRYGKDWEKIAGFAGFRVPGEIHLRSDLEESGMSPEEVRAELESARTYREVGRLSTGETEIKMLALATATEERVRRESSAEAPYPCGRRRPLSRYTGTPDAYSALVHYSACQYPECRARDAEIQHLACALIAIGASRSVDMAMAKLAKAHDARTTELATAHATGIEDERSAVVAMLRTGADSEDTARALRPIYLFLSMLIESGRHHEVVEERDREPSVAITAGQEDHHSAPISHRRAIGNYG